MALTAPTGGPGTSKRWFQCVITMQQIWFSKLFRTSAEFVHTQWPAAIADTKCRVTRDKHPAQIHIPAGLACLPPQGVWDSVGHQAQDCIVVENKSLDSPTKDSLLELIQVHGSYLLKKKRTRRGDYLKRWSVSLIWINFVAYNLENLSAKSWSPCRFLALNR